MKYHEKRNAKENRRLFACMCKSMCIGSGETKGKQWQRQCEWKRSSESETNYNKLTNGK